MRDVIHNSDDHKNMNIIKNIIRPLQPPHFLDPCHMLLPSLDDYLHARQYKLDYKCACLPVSIAESSTLDAAESLLSKVSVVAATR